MNDHLDKSQTLLAQAGVLHGQYSRVMPEQIHAKVTALTSLAAVHVQAAAVAATNDQTAAIRDLAAAIESARDTTAPSTRNV